MADNKVMNEVMVEYVNAMTDKKILNSAQINHLFNIAFGGADGILYAISIAFNMGYHAGIEEEKE